MMLHIRLVIKIKKVALAIAQQLSTYIMYVLKT
jgi:hypothetical protein